MEAKIEKVGHSNVSAIHTCCLIDYFEKSDRLIQINFTDPVFAKEMCLSYTIGMWRIKSLKNKNN